MRYDLHPTTLTDYIKEKIEMLKEDFKIRLTVRETKHLKSLLTEIAVDNYIKTIIYTKL